MLAQHFHYMYRRALVFGASSHSGRKTFITSLASQGVSVFVLASLAGHRQISTTQKYVTTNDDMKRREQVTHEDNRRNQQCALDEPAAI